MIRFVCHQEIVPELWDRAVLTSACPTALATFELLNALTGDAQWDALVEDEYKAVLPLPHRTKAGISYIYTPFFLPRMGIFAPKPVDAKKTLEFFNAIPDNFKQVDLLFNPCNDATLLPSEKVELVSHVTCLNRPYDEMAKGFSTNTRRNIHAAEKHFLTIEKNEKFVEPIINLFKDNRGKSRSVHYKSQDYQHLAEAAKLLIKAKRLDVMGVFNPDQRLMAGAFMVRDVDRTWFWFSGRDEAVSEAKPMFFLLNEYLKNLSDSGIMFDFNGSTNENVARMYKGFGGLPYPIVLVQHSQKGIKPLVTLKRKVAKILPKK